jgi:glycerol-3-phosphate dehydrogenase
LIGGTKGSHIVVPPFPGAPHDALYFEARADGRAIFVIPWNGNYLIGTTDIRFDQPPDSVQADDDEITYLVNETNALIPSAHLSPDAIVYTYSGVRPLPYQPKGKEGAITRRHLIHDHAPHLRGLLSIIGGKLTTHRSLAEEVVDLACSRLGIDAPCPTAGAPLPGAAGVALEPFRKQLVRESGLSESQAHRLVSLYGARAKDVLEHAAAAPDLIQPFDPQTGALGAEVVHAVRCEWAENLQDVLMRRTMAGLAPGMAVGADEAAAAIAARHLGWDQARCSREVAEYRASLSRFRPRIATAMTATT